MKKIFLIINLLIISSIINNAFCEERLELSGSTKNQKGVISENQINPSQSKEVSNALKLVEPFLEKNTASSVQTEQNYKSLEPIKNELLIMRENHRFIISIMVLTAGLFSLFVVLWFITKKNCSSNDIVHSSGLVIIVFSTIIITTVADVDQQLTAAIGILGAMAGYLFGSAKNTGNREASVTNDPDAKK